MAMYDTPLAAEYRHVILSPMPTAGDLALLIEPYCAIVVTQFNAILDRTERHRNREGGIYPWIDTKLDLTTGEDLPHDHPWLGLGLVSGWVQGRGLEGLAAFGAWLAPYAASPEIAALSARIRRLVADLAGKVRAVRRANGGHLYFAMTPAGEPFQLDEAYRRVPVPLDASSPSNFSDLFAAKGLYAAARFLDDAEMLAEAREWCLALGSDILAGRFCSDQPQPKGLASVVAVPGGISHGPAMIALGMAALLARHEPGPEAAEMGLRFARRVLYGHVNLENRWPMLRPFDLVEFIGRDGRPAVDAQGRVIGDPGHALEFVGLCLKFKDIVARYGGATLEQEGELRHMAHYMPSILASAFEAGFRPALGGIVKTVDLVTRAPIDDTMPWWSLPETIRAAMEATHASADPENWSLGRRIIAQCHNAFVEHYLRPAVHLMAVKLRDREGRVSALVPAYPDADPAYHTALSLMDVLAVLTGSPASATAGRCRRPAPARPQPAHPDPSPAGSGTGGR